MSRVARLHVVSGGVESLARAIDGIRGQLDLNGAPHLEDRIHAPLTGELRHQVLARLRRGERTIVVDLSGVPSIDAAAVGQLVRAYNVTKAATGSLRIVCATRWVREVLERAGLFGLLSCPDLKSERLR
jgi:anti-anti-sigma factor